MSGDYRLNPPDPPDTVECQHCGIDTERVAYVPDCKGAGQSCEVCPPCYEAWVESEEEARREEAHS